MIFEISTARPVSNYGFGEAARHISERAVSAHLKLAKGRLVGAIQHVAERQDNWDGRGSARPDTAACLRAAVEGADFIETAFALDFGWQHPHIGANEYGEISFEWWRGAKRLTIYVGMDEVRYVCSWGADINQHMDADVLHPQGFAQKWRWFRT